MKTVVITGASRGIGLATAKLFLKEGWNVIGTFSTNVVPLELPNMEVIRMNLGSSESIEHAVQRIEDITFNIDVLVNNAGIILDAWDEGVHMEKIKKTVDVDLLGPIQFTERLIPLMHTESHIINVNSSYGSMSLPIDDATSVGYRIAKAGLNMYTKTLAFRLDEPRIIVSSLDPGWVKTDMGNAGATETAKPDREPEDVASDIMQIVKNVKDSGNFWRFGEKVEW